MLVVAGLLAGAQQEGLPLAVQRPAEEAHRDHMPAWAVPSAAGLADLGGLQELP